MKKLNSFILWTLSIFILILLAASYALIKKEPYSYLLNYFAEQKYEFTLSKTKWHPFEPYIEIANLKIETKSGLIKAENIIIEYSLISLFKGNLISKLSLSDVVIQGFENSNSSKNFFDYLNFVEKIDSLSIQNLAINFSDNSTFTKLNLVSVSEEDERSLRLDATDLNSNSLVLKILSDGNFLKGTLNGDNYMIQNRLLDMFCYQCDLSAELGINMNFVLFEKKILSMHGNLDLKTTDEIFGINSFRSSFVLQDSDDFLFQFGTEIATNANRKDYLRLPGFFMKFSPSLSQVIIPEIDLSSKNLTDLLSSNKDLHYKISGLLRNTVINLDGYKNPLTSTVIGLDISLDELRFRGIDGNLVLDRDKAKLQIDSPIIQISSEKYFDEDLTFDDFSSDLSLPAWNKGFEISPSSFSAVFKGQRIDGLISLANVPSRNKQNINLRLKTKSINVQSILSLLPNEKDLLKTKVAFKEFADCGSFDELNLIIRAPLGKGQDSRSFSLQSNVNDLCLNLNGFSLEKVDGKINIDNLNIEGSIQSSFFQGSKLRSDFRSYNKDDETYIEVEGSSEGPFLTLVSFLIENPNQSDIKGSHKTDFSYSSKVDEFFLPLRNQGEYKILTKVENGKFQSNQAMFNLDNIFSSIHFASETGFKEGYISLKLNSIPFLFELDESSKQEKFAILKSENSVQINKVIPKEYKNFFNGLSKVNSKIYIPNFDLIDKIQDLKFEFSSNSRGTEIKLLDPFRKSKEEFVEVNLKFYPFYANDFARLNFKYGDLFRGKLNLYENFTEGFIIAGKKKQSISISKNYLTLIGGIEKFDLSLLSQLQDIGTSEKSNFKIKKLEIEDLFFSNFSFQKTTLRSGELENIFVSNRDISGTFYFPRKEYQYPFVDLDFINLKFLETDSDSFNLDFLKNIQTKIKFETDSFIVNSKEYGNWSFDLNVDGSTIFLENIEGKYGKWGLTKNRNGISRLNIFKEGKAWKTQLMGKIYSGSPEKAFAQIGISPNFEMDTFFTETDITVLKLPWQASYVDVYGNFSVEIKGLLIRNREDLKTTNNILRLVNIFNVTDSFEKVTNLDFRKLYKSGFSADTVKGNFEVTKNSIIFEKPLVFKSGSSEFKWKGKISRDEKGNLGNLNLEVIMTLPLREYLPAYALLLGGPIAAGVIYIAGKAFERNLDQISSGSWSIQGSLQDPKTEFNGWFENREE
tara:strand:- start:10483 stop:14082 length:3600 start_codon:yes stop_codon:yes gene_type:complete